MPDSEPVATTRAPRSRLAIPVPALAVCITSAAVLLAALFAVRDESDPKVELLIGAIVLLTLTFAAVLLVLINRLAHSSTQHASSEMRYREARQVLAENQRRIAHLAHHDALTGLPSRLHLQSRLPRLLARAARKDRELALMYVDVDQFKNINDSRGHGTGDVLLRVIAGRLKHAVASRDLVVRMGGDEFVIIAYDVGDRAGAESLARRLHDGAERADRCERDAARRSPSAWESACTRRTASIRRSCSSTPTSPCTRPRIAAGTISRCSRPT